MFKLCHYCGANVTTEPNVLSFGMYLRVSFLTCNIELDSDFDEKRKIKKLYVSLKYETKYLHICKFFISKFKDATLMTI